MGFFDDLEDKVGSIPEHDAPTIPAGDYEAVIAKLKDGWAPKLRRNEPMKTQREAAHIQEVELQWDGERFVWSTRMLEQRGKRLTDVLSEDQRRMDEQGLIDAFIDNPWVGQACLKGAGVDTSKPDF